jgi:MFS transporter, DHA2 family, multidrug resistance protein
MTNRRCQLPRRTLLQPAPGPTGEHTGALRRLALAAVLLTTLISTIDTSIVNVALPQIAKDLGAAPAHTVWVATAFLLAVACAVPATSALGEQIGRRPLFLLGVPLFTAASLGCALAPNLATLIALRAVQGVGSAVILAVAIPLIRGLFPPEQLGRALGLNAMVVALGTSLGPALGGVILAGLDWPWLFLVNVPIGVISFAFAAVALPRSEPTPGDYDWPGALWIAAAIACFLVGVRQLASTDTLWHAALLLVGCAASLAVFVRRERTAARPVIPLGLFTRGFTLTVATAWTSFVAQGVVFVALPFLLQSSLGLSPLRSALLFTPWPIAIVLVAPVSGRLADRVRPSLLAVVGLVVLTVGLAGLAALGTTPPEWLVIVATAVCGIGFGTFQSPNNREMMAAAPVRHTASASAVLHTNRSIGQSAGSAAVSIALVATGASAGSLARQADAASAVLWVAVAAAAAASLLVAARLRAASAQ